MAFTVVVTLLVAYLIGSIPFGFIVVWVAKGRDVRQVASGRTGGTNVMRAAGFLAGLLTAIMDVLKGAAAVWLARYLMPGFTLLHVIAPIFAILGHNYSIFLLQRGEDDRLRFSGGAGGATCAGGALGLWPPIILIILPLCGMIWYGIGYASVTTMSIALLAAVIFAGRAAMGLSPWLYVLYGVIAEAVVLWALRPNIKRLMNGNERLIGWRARRQAQPPREL